MLLAFNLIIVCITGCFLFPYTKPSPLLSPFRKFFFATVDGLLDSSQRCVVKPQINKDILSHILSFKLC